MDYKKTAGKVNLSKINAWQRGVLVSALFLPVILYEAYQYFRVPDHIQNQSDKVFLKIPRGAGLDDIIDSLYNKQLINDKELFKIWLVAMEKDTEIKAGHFEIPKHLNYAQLATYLTKANAKQIKVTLIEGWTIEEIGYQLQQDLEINRTAFLELTKDTAFIRSLGIDASSLEGYLIPDTYYFYWGINERQLIEFLSKRCLALFDDQARKQMDSLDMSINQILTLASIIEGEAILDSERPVISSVYHNRLNKGMRLQADPTIQYIVPGPPKRLTNRDLRINSPYNTYLYYGLPPGPINNPGENSIKAAIYPAKTKYLYFVATGDGSHAFTRTAAEHNREKAKFNRIRREVYSKKDKTN